MYIQHNKVAWYFEKIFKMPGNSWNVGGSWGMEGIIENKIDLSMSEVCRAEVSFSC